MKSDITKVTSHINPNEALIFERSQPGRVGYRLPPLDVDEQSIADLIPQQFLRDDDLEGVPEVSHVDVELFDRPGHVSARLVHDEIQLALERESGAHTRVRRSSSTDRSRRRPG